MLRLRDMRFAYRNVAALRAAASADANVTVREYRHEVVVSHKHDPRNLIYGIDDDGSLTFLMYEWRRTR